MADIPAEMDSAYSSSEFPPTDPAADLLALTSVAMFQRSNSAIAFKSQRKQHLHWLRRSLPPAKRERRGEKAKSSGTPKGRMHCRTFYTAFKICELQTINGRPEHAPAFTIVC